MREFMDGIHFELVAQGLSLEIQSLGKMDVGRIGFHVNFRSLQSALQTRVIVELHSFYVEIYEKQKPKKSNLIQTEINLDDADFPDYDNEEESP